MADTGHRDHHSDRCARASPQGGVAGSDKDYAYANDDNDHEDDHEDDHGEDEYELSDEQAAEARGALLSPVLRFRLDFFNQESLLFGCCGPWASGNITTANWQYAGPTAGRSSPGSELESRHRASSYSRFVEVLQVSSPVGGLGFAAAPAPLAFVSVRFRLSSCLIRWTAECVVYSS